MPRRIDVELTSDRGDGSWSWRAAGAKQPKGVVDGSLLYPDAQVGDVVRVDADFDIEGITILAVQPPKGARAEPERIEVRGVEKEFTPVTSSLTGKARERAERGEEDRPRRSRDDRGPRPAGRPGGPGRDGDRGPRPSGGDRPGRGDRPERSDRPQRPARPAPPPPRPKAKKLRPARTHRDALLATLAPEQTPIAEQLLRGGMPAVRQAVEEQNAKAKAEDGLEIPVDTVMGIAEQLVGRTRVADWLDRAEAAKETGDELALRDLRSVVSSADDVARDESTRELAAELKAMLEQRTESEQQTWVSDIEESLSGGRVVRALRLSSRPPEPGTTLSADLTARLTDGAGAALTADIAPDRWATVLDAVAYSPVRRAVVPAGHPAEPTEELLVAVRKHAGRTPAIAALFGIEAPPEKGRGPKRPDKGSGRNPNLSRGGGRGGAVPVPGRPGGPPVPPAKRIPPPPGRQIGATLPGSPPVPPPPAAADPTALLTPPGPTDAGEPIASTGTPEATATAAPSVDDGAAVGVDTDPAEAAQLLDAAPTLLDGPGPEATAALGAAAGTAPGPAAEPPSVDPLSSPAAEATVGGAVATDVPADAPVEPPPPVDPLSAPAAEATSGGGLATGAAPVEAAAPPDPAGADDGATGAADAVVPPSPVDVVEALGSPTTATVPAPTVGEDDPSADPIADAPAADAPASDAPAADAPAADAPAADPSPGDPTPTAGDVPTEAGDVMDAVVSQAAGGPFEPPAESPVPDAADRGVGGVPADPAPGPEPDRPSDASAAPPA